MNFTLIEIKEGLFLQGLIIGFSIAAPVGPIGVLCIRRTLAHGRKFGLMTGLGAASADAIYASIAGFGLTIVANFLVEQQWVRLIGGAFLCFLGFRTFYAIPERGPIEAARIGLWNAYLTTFLLTITNPITVLSFGAIFAGLGLAEQEGVVTSSFLMVLGVFMGSAVWWFFLSGLVSFFRERIDFKAMRWVNRISGLIILAFGIAAIVSAMGWLTES